MNIPNQRLFQRVTKLYQGLPRSPQSPIPVDELKDKIRAYYNDNVEEKSLTKAIQRDLLLITQILSTGKLLRTNGSGNLPTSYRLSADASIESLKPELSLVLVMANQYLRQYLPGDIYRQVEGFFEAAECQLKKHTNLDDWPDRVRFIHEGYSPTDDDAGLRYDADKIYYALLHPQYWLNVEYERTDSVTNTYILKPHGMIHHGRKQLLLASKVVGNTSELRTFLMHGFKHVELIPEKISIHVDSYDIESLIAQKEHEDAYCERKIMSLKIRCNNELLSEIEQNPLTHMQEIEKTYHGYFYVTAHLMITQSLFNWLVEKAHAVKVIEPQEIYYRVRRKVIAAAELYELDWDINDEGDEHELDISPLEEDWDIVDEILDDEDIESELEDIGDLDIDGLTGDKND